MGSSKTVVIKGLSIGGGSPVRVESMIKTPLSDIYGCAEECTALAAEGCELIWVSLRISPRTEHEGLTKDRLCR